MVKAKYLVRFTDCKHSPNFKNLSSCSIKIGTFQHYRKIELENRKDSTEGQRGLLLKVKKPCELLKKLFVNQIDDFELNSKDEFVKNFYVDISNHSNEFNTWMFCASAINDLSEIEELKKEFSCDCYYFIKDFEKFENSIQASLAENLKNHPNDHEGNPRVNLGKDKLYYLTGERKFIKYVNLKKNMSQECETLSDFYKSQDSRQVNSDLWFYKPEEYKPQKEFRFLLYAVTDKNRDKYFLINDDFVILNCDLTDAISETPVEIIQ